MILREELWLFEYLLKSCCLKIICFSLHIESHASTIIQIDNKYEEYWFRYIYEVPEVDVETYIRNIQKDK